MTSLSLDLYKKFFLCRRAEDYIIKYYHEDDMKTPMHMSYGQEFIPVGILSGLGDAAQVFSTYRSHAPYLSRTEDVEGFFMELYGKAAGPAEGKAGSMHMADPKKGHIYSSAIVASTIPVAVGMGYANKFLKNGKISVAFFGDGAVDEGVFWESINVASVMKTPVVFICEDNGLAVHTSREHRQGFKSITEIVRNFDCHVFADNTTDVEAIYQLGVQVRELIQKDPKPVFLHLECYRYLEHVGIFEDFNAGYRIKDESWITRGPLRTQRQRLLDQGMDEKELLQIEQKIDDRIQAAVLAAKAAEFPASDRLYAGVFHA